MLIWCILQRTSYIKVIVFLWHQHQWKNQVLGNHCVFSPIYLMLNRKKQNVVLEIHNQTAEPWRLVIACGPLKKYRKGHSKMNEQCCERVYILIKLSGALETKLYLVRYSVCFWIKTRPSDVEFLKYSCWRPSRSTLISGSTIKSCNWF